MTSPYARPAASLLLVLASLALAGCSSTTSPLDAAADTLADARSCAPSQPANPCRSSADCNAARFEGCVAPGENVGCGACFAAPHDCVTDADCAPVEGLARVCLRTFYPCADCGGGDGFGTSCVPRCESVGCAPGTACGTDGRCAPIRCDAGYSCPVGTTCETSGGDGHGCVRASCTTDSDCPCGTGCVEGRCHESLGMCEPPRA